MKLKKELLKENEKLNHKLKDLENKVFDEKIKLVYDILESIGSVGYEVEHDRYLCSTEYITESRITFTLRVSR